MRAHGSLSMDINIIGWPAKECFDLQLRQLLRWNLLTKLANYPLIASWMVQFALLGNDGFARCPDERAVVAGY